MSNLHGRNWRERGVIANPAIPREQTREQQDRERDALSRVDAPFPVHDLPHHPLDCPDPLGIHCAESSKVIVHEVTGAPPSEADDLEERGLRAGEPLSLVEQNKKLEP